MIFGAGFGLPDGAALYPGYGVDEFCLYYGFGLPDGAALYPGYGYGFGLDLDCLTSRMALRSIRTTVLGLGLIWTA